MDARCRCSGESSYHCLCLGWLLICGDDRNLPSACPTGRPTHTHRIIDGTFGSPAQISRATDSMAGIVIKESLKKSCRMYHPPHVKDEHDHNNRHLLNGTESTFAGRTWAARICTMPAQAKHRPMMRNSSFLCPSKNNFVSCEHPQIERLSRFGDASTSDPTPCEKARN